MFIRYRYIVSMLSWWLLLKFTFFCCVISLCVISCCIAINLGYFKWQVITIGDKGDKMSIVGKIHEFKPESEQFSTYVERLELYFNASSVTEKKKVPIFLLL